MEGKKTAAQLPEKFMQLHGTKKQNDAAINTQTGHLGFSFKTLTKPFTTLPPTCNL